MLVNMHGDGDERRERGPQRRSDAARRGERDEVGGRGRRGQPRRQGEHREVVRRVALGERQLDPRGDDPGADAEADRPCCAGELRPADDGQAAAATSDERRQRPRPVVGVRLVPRQPELAEQAAAEPGALVAAVDPPAAPELGEPPAQPVPGERREHGQRGAPGQHDDAARRHSARCSRRTPGERDGGDDGGREHRRDERLHAQPEQHADRPRRPRARRRGGPVHGHDARAIVHAVARMAIVMLRL